MMPKFAEWETYKDKSGTLRMRTRVRCLNCGKIRTIDKRHYYKALKEGNWTGLCSKCISRPKGSDSPKWKGGLIKKADGYRLMWVSVNDPFACMRDVRGYVYEHRYVVAKKIGRPLRPTEQVHHLNGIKADNRPENLEILNEKDHHLITKLEKRIRELEAEVVYLKERK